MRVTILVLFAGLNSVVAAQEQQVVRRVEEPVAGAGVVRNVLTFRRPTLQTIETVAATEIKLMQAICELNDQQVRMLQIAAKGVATRLKPSVSDVAIGAGAGFARRNLGGRTVVQTVSREQLVSNSLWKRTVERVLTDEQRTLWDKAPKPAQTGVLGGIRPVRQNMRVVPPEVVRQIVERALEPQVAVENDE